MAEGGGDFGFEDPKLDRAIDNNDMTDEKDRTWGFGPGEASTPYGGEQYEMQTMVHEQSGLPSYDDETIPLLSPDKDAELSRRLANLRENAETGLLDISKIPKVLKNPLSEEEKEEQIRRVKNFIKSRYPYANVDNLVTGYSQKNSMELVVKGKRGGETK